MKYLLLLIALLTVNLAFGQTNPDYDKALAEKLGADEYGMKSYFLVMLKTGPNTTTDQELINESFRGHLENINRLEAEGILIVAGPLDKNDKNYRGIFILNNLKSKKKKKEVQEEEQDIAE